MGIILYSTQNVEKSSVIERFNRTLKNKMFKEFTVQNSTVYIDILEKGYIRKVNNKDKNRI